MQQNRDPIHRDDEEQYWYFWDETWSHLHGPFDTEAIAREKLREYCETL